MRDRHEETPLGETMVSVATEIERDLSASHPVACFGDLESTTRQRVNPYSVENPPTSPGRPAAESAFRSR